MGGAGATAINGKLEANAPIIFTGGGTKTFRNGIIGSASVDGLTGTSGKFIINGATAQLGGAGNIIVPAAGFEIGSATGTTVTLISDKTVTGDITLLSTNTYVETGSYNLTVTGLVNGGSSTSYIKTNGTGTLTLNAVNAVGKTFPIGNATYNPLVISNGNGANYSTRVQNSINPAIGFPAYGINRTWNISASAQTTGVTVIFQYNLADANANATPQPMNMEILLNTGAPFAGWDVIPGNTGIGPAGGDPYTVTTATALTIQTASTPYALGKSGGYLLPVDFYVSAGARKSGSTAQISWNVYEPAGIRDFEVQRSAGNNNFTTIGTVPAQPDQLNYRFSDNLGQDKTIFYRIRVNRLTAAPRYSNTIALLNQSAGFLLSLYPNPVADQASIGLSTANSGNVQLQLFDFSGKALRYWQMPVSAGSNILPLDAGNLRPGIYLLQATDGQTRSFLRFIKQ